MMAMLLIIEHIWKKWYCMYSPHTLRMELVMCIGRIIMDEEMAALLI